MIAILVAVASFVGSELSDRARNHIWASVPRDIPKAAFVESNPETGPPHIEGWQKFEQVIIEKKDIEKALWEEFIVVALIFFITGYLVSCVVVAAGNENEI